MANYSELVRQANIAAVASRAGDVGVSQDVIDMYSSAPKIDSKRPKTGGRLTEKLIEDTDTFKANLDMKIEAWKARIIKEVWF